VAYKERRFIEILSQIMKIKYKIPIKEIVDPIEDTIFHEVKASG